MHYISIRSVITLKMYHFKKKLTKPKTKQLSKLLLLSTRAFKRFNSCILTQMLLLPNILFSLCFVPQTIIILNVQSQCLFYIDS